MKREKMKNQMRRKLKNRLSHEFFRNLWALHKLWNICSGAHLVFG